MSGRGGKREGAGRPKTLKGTTIRFSLRLDDETAQLLNSAISQLYGDENRTYKVSEFIRNAIREYANHILKTEGNK